MRFDTSWGGGSLGWLCWCADGRDEDCQPIAGQIGWSWLEKGKGFAETIVALP